MPKRKGSVFHAKIPLDRLQRGPIQHAALPDVLVERIKNFKALLIEVEPAPLDEIIEDFQRDLHPEPEIAEDVGALGISAPRTSTSSKKGR